MYLSGHQVCNNDRFCCLSILLIFLLSNLPPLPDQSICMKQFILFGQMEQYRNIEMLNIDTCDRRQPSTLCKAPAAFSCSTRTFESRRPRGRLPATFASATVVLQSMPLIYLMSRSAPIVATRFSTTFRFSNKKRGASLVFCRKTTENISIFSKQTQTANARQ
jgi:hypothetical protein